MRTALIIPTADRPELLKRAVKSALNQYVAFDQILIVNDGNLSLPPLQINHSVKIISTGGYKGLPYARSFGVQNLDKDIQAICYLDDDDELLPNHHSLFIEEIKTCHFAFSKAIFKYSNGFETEDPEPNNTGIKRYYDPTALLSQNIAPVSSFIHTLEAYNEVGGWDTEVLRLEDWDLWGRMFLRYGPPIFVNQVTNIIHKGTSGNLTDGNSYSYSMACSWRDVVSDRLKLLTANKRYKLTKEDREKSHVAKVGVVMPVYNAERYLRQSLESVLQQSFSDFEVIIINDGSTDNSKKIIEEYLRADKRMRYFESYRNEGVTKALNFGLLVSRSEYIARMDADDVCERERFEKQVQYLDEHQDVMVLGTSFLSMDETLTKTIWVNNVPTDPEEIKNILLERCCIGHPTVMMRHRIIELMNGYNESEKYQTVEDYELWLRISRRFKISNLPQFLLKHRTYNGQVSNRLADKQAENAMKLRAEYRG